MWMITPEPWSSIAGKSARSSRTAGNRFQVERALPLAIVAGREAARGRRRATDDVDDDVDAAQAIAHRLGHGRAACAAAEVGRHETGPRLRDRSVRVRAVLRTLTPSSRSRAVTGPADPLRAPGDERAAARELEPVAHEGISIEAVMRVS